MVMNVKDAQVNFWQGEARNNQSDSYFENTAKNREIGKRVQAELDASRQISGEQRKAQEALDRARSAEDELEQLRTKAAEADHYRELLAKPLKDLLQEGADFKKAYEMQKELMQNWMVSQEAFRQLAKKYRTELGKTSEEAKAEYDRLEKEAKERLEKTGKVKAD
jgi:hypothetical protein